MLDVLAALVGIGIVCTYGFEGFADSLEPFLNTVALFWIVLFAALVALMF